jgi:O-antigen/teichoic acid export membrane protein
MLKKLAGETVIYGMSHILPRILNYVVMTVYLTYKFTDTSDFGIYSDLYAYATVILTFMVFRMDTAYFRFGSRSTDLHKVFSTAFIPLLSVTAALVMAMIVFSKSTSVWLQYPDQSYYVIWFAGILAFDSLTALVYARFRLESRPFRFLFFRSANVIFTLGFVMLFLEILPVWAPELLHWISKLTSVSKELDFVFLSNLLASFLVFLSMIPEFLKIKFSFDKELYKKMIQYSLPLVIVGIAGSINQAVAVPLQKYLLGGEVTENLSRAGIYSAGAKLAILLNLFTTAYNYAAEPFFFNNAAGQNRKDVYGDMALAFTIFTGTIALFTYLYIDIVLMIIGPQYRTGVIVVPLLLVSYLFLGLYYNFSIWYKLADKTHIGGYISLLAVAITVLVSVLTLPTIGIIGSAWASLACYAFMAGAGYVTGQKYYPLSYPIGKISSLIAMVILFMLVSWFIRNGFESSFSIRLLLNTVLGLVFLCIVYVKEKSEVLRLLRQK